MLPINKRRSVSYDSLAQFQKEEKINFNDGSKNEFNNANTNQSYIYCDLSNKIQCKRTSSCQAFYYGKYNKNGLFCIKK